MNKCYFRLERDLFIDVLKKQKYIGRIFCKKGLTKAQKAEVCLWLSHCFLRKLGKKNPKYFMTLMNEVSDNKRQIEIMRLRYIENMKFEAIAIKLNTDVRYMFVLHKKMLEQLCEV